MVIALTPGHEWDYICKCDRELPEEEQTVWRLRTLTEEQYRQLVDKLTTTDQESGELRFNLGSHIYRAVRYGLVGVKNFRDENGKEIELVTTQRGPKPEHAVVRDEFIAKIPPQVRHELADAIVERNKLAHSEAKN